MSLPIRSPSLTLRKLGALLINAVFVKLTARWESSTVCLAAATTDESEQQFPVCDLCASGFGTTHELFRNTRAWALPQPRKPGSGDGPRKLFAQLFGSFLCRLARGNPCCGWNSWSGYCVKFHLDSATNVWVRAVYAAYMLQRRKWVVATGTMWPADSCLQPQGKVGITRGLVPNQLRKKADNITATYIIRCVSDEKSTYLPKINLRS